MSEVNPTAPVRPNLSAGGQLLLFIAAAVAIWVILSGYVFHLHTLFGSFLFLWYWATIEEAAYKKVIPCALGACAGAVLAWQLWYLSSHFGTEGLVVGLLILAAAILVQIMNWAPFIINPSAMLFLTVFTAPVIMGSLNLGDAIASILTGSVYFSGAVLVAKRYAAYRARTARLRATSQN